MTTAEIQTRISPVVRDETLDKFKVPAQEKGELLTALGGMKGQIVGK